jgi:hypothetical protein
MTDRDRVTYAYAVLRDDAALTGPLTGLTGVAGAPVRLVRAVPGDDLAAAVSAVPAPDFEEDALRHHLENLEWLETMARAHHRVIEGLTEHTTVLPLRLATVYLDDARVRAVLEDDREMFTVSLARLAAHVEWGVKIYVEPPPDDAAAPAPSPDADLGPGRAYLRARTAQRHLRDEAYRAAQTAAARVEAVGRALAAGHARHRVQQGEIAPGPGENVVNDAYLVDHGHAEQFRTETLRAVEGLRGVRIEVTGPWAPYSFAEPPEAAAKAGNSR